MVAANDVNVTAKQIELLTANDVNSEHQDSKDTKVGVFARVYSPLIDLVNNAEAARQSDGRLAMMQGMSAAASAYQAASAISSMAGGPGGGALLGAEAGIGFAQGKSQYDGSSTEAVGSTISGGRNVTLTSTEGDIHGVQANLTAGDTLTLDSADDILLEAGKSQYASDGRSSNVGAEVGVGVSVGAQTGVYVYGQVNAGSSKSNSDATYYENTHLAADTITLKSKGDTTLKGADARANTINADVDGALTIESVQDTVTETSKDSGFSARAQVSFGTAWSASGNASSAKAGGSYTAVNQQSGLFAGDGGYHVNADSVNLEGGAITSTNAGNSELTANSLTFSDLQNRMDYQASSASISGGVSGGNGSGSQNSVGQQSADIKNVLNGSTSLGKPNGASFGGGVPMQESGKDSSTTYATLTEGNITIGGQKTSAADLGLHTDAATAHTAIQELPDLQKVLADQQAMSAAAGNVIGTSQQIAGDIAANAQAKADAIGEGVYDTLSDAERQAYAGMTQSEREAFLSGKSADYAQALGTAKDWGTGGDYSRALGAITTALVGGVAGQGNTQVLSNALAPYAAQLIGEKFDANHGSDPNAVAQVLSHALLGALLAEVNGGSAAGGALAAGGGELAAQVLTKELYGSTNPQDLTEQQKQMISGLSSMLGALAGGIAGGDNGGLYNAAVSGNVAQNAVDNNWLKQQEYQWLKDAKVACGQGDAVSCQLVAEIQALDKERDAGYAANVDIVNAEMKLDGVTATQDEFDRRMAAYWESQGIDPRDAVYPEGGFTRTYPSAGEELYNWLGNAAGLLPDWYPGKPSAELSGQIVQGFLEQGGRAWAGWEDIIHPHQSVNYFTGEVVEGADAWNARFGSGTELIATWLTGGGNNILRSGAKGLTSATDDVLENVGEAAFRKAQGVYGPDGRALMGFSQLTSDQKRVVGEVLGADTATGTLPNAQQLARAQGTGTNGIDELYKISSPDVDYVHIEYKFVSDPAKTGANRLDMTNDGLQGSETWMTGSGRLEKAVGDETALDVQRAIRGGRVESWVITVRPNGATEIQILDAAGKPKPSSTSRLLPKTSPSPPEGGRQ